MQAYGTDRVRRGSGSQWILFCRRSKGWIGRIPGRTLVASEAPGSAVLWEEQYFEVVSETVSASGVRYVLEPWRDETIMRGVGAYDETSEAAREAEHAAAQARHTHRHTVRLFGILLGHLPAAVQERLGSELGIFPVRLTLVSLLIPLVVIGLIVMEGVERYMAPPGTTPLPFGLIPLALFLGMESAIRMFVALSQNRPLGSVAGWLIYSLYYLAHPGRRSLAPPIERPSPDRLRREVPPEIRQNDFLITVEPLLTLLGAGEQRALAERLGYDYRRSSTKVAVILLVCGLMGIVSSAVSLSEGGGLSPMLSLLGATGIAVEQLVRLRAFRNGPAGSVLGPLVRPLFRRLVSPASQR